MRRATRPPKPDATCRMNQQTEALNHIQIVHGHHDTHISACSPIVPKVTLSLKKSGYPTELRSSHPIRLAEALGRDKRQEKSSRHRPKRTEAEAPGRPG